MKNNFKIFLFCFYYMINVNTIIAQNKDEISISKLNKRSAIVTLDGTILDTLVAKGARKKYAFLKVNKLQKKIYISRLVIPGVASFENSYISIEVWEVISNELKSKKIKIKLNNQKIKNVRVKFLNDGVNIILKKSCFKNVKYFIPYEKFDKLENLTFPNGSDLHPYGSDLQFSPDPERIR